MEKKPTPKRIICNVHPVLHKKIKLAATFRNMTISRYILQAVAWRLENDSVKDNNV